MSLTEFSDLNLREATGYCRGLATEFGKTGVRATNGSSAAGHLPPLRGEVSGPLSSDDNLPPRPVPVHGLRPTDVPQKPAVIEVCLRSQSSKLYQPGHPWRDCSQCIGGCQREAGLGHLRGLRAQPNPSCPQAFAPSEVLRCLTRRPVGVPDKPLRSAHTDHFENLSLPKESGAFLKWIKHHLCIKAFFGMSENAVKTQV